MAKEHRNLAPRIDEDVRRPLERSERGRAQRLSIGVVTKSIPGGRCAHVIHEGSQDNMERTIYPLYRQWLPESGEKTRDFPVFFQYHNFFPEVPEVELTASIYLPIE